MWEILNYTFGILFILNLLYQTRMDWTSFLIRLLPFSLARFFIFTPNMLYWVLKKIPYKTDMELYGKEEYWARADEFWKHKGGDCEDYANFAVNVMRYQAYEAQRKDYYINGVFGHAIAIATKDHENWYIFDMYWMEKVKADSFDNAYERYVSDYTKIIPS